MKAIFPAQAKQSTADSASKATSRKILQRKCACGQSARGGAECSECQEKKRNLQRKSKDPSAPAAGHSLSRLGILQPKLTVGASNDPLEQEADRVAEQVLAAPPQTAVSGTPLHIQRLTGQPTGQLATAPASVDRVLASPGTALDAALQEDMSRRFGHDFSRVRVHSDTAAQQSAREVSAHAYTVGHNLVFGAGQFTPGTRDGRRLIAHELTHVVQQSGGFSAPELRLQRSLWSGFLDVVLFIPRLFGLEVFPAEDLREYLGVLKQKRGPEDGIFSDNKARACVSRENEFGPYDTQTKIWLIQEMLGGHTSFLDEGSVITLLRRSPTEIAPIVSAVGRDRLWSKFSGGNRRIIEAMTLTAADAGDALVARLRTLDPSEIQVYAANATDPAVRESVRRAAALANITAPVPTEAAITAAGEATFTINGVNVIVRPDRINPALGKRALTWGQFGGTTPAPVAITPENANQPVGPFAPLEIHLRIWTEYGSDDAKKKSSAYGVGTRPQDQNTLGAHERAHGEGWFTFLRNNPPPVFTGTSAMLPAQFNAAVQQWLDAFNDYDHRAHEFSLKAGDCVGTLPTTEQLAGTGFTAAICHQD
jgi:hypothetical protein